MDEELCASILEFWFGGDERAKYRQRWFPGGDPEAEKRADADVGLRFGDALQAVLRLDVESAAALVQSRPRSWSIALIVLTDQFSRHVFRLRQLGPSAPERAHADAQALRVAEELTAQPGWDQGLSMSQYVFSLMPFRHSASVARLEGVVGHIERREALEAWGSELLGRFRKQTVRRLQHLQDRAKADEDPGAILEREEFAADESGVMDEPLVATVRAFLLLHLPPLPAPPSSSSPPLQSSQAPVPVTLSLSGGVDSMVIGKILCLLRDRCPDVRARLCPCQAGEQSTLPSHSPRPAITAIHIDYANRPESAQEAAFVERWSLALGIDFRKRVVSEVTRGVTDRAVYERVSRDARYGCYTAVLAETGSPAVIFGHHQGDVQENVLSNVMHGKSPLQLSGMREVGVTNGVSVWRPLLRHCKDEIFAFAHRYGVPYFKDTTPSWSTRGKLRNQLVPLLLDMYGAGCLRNLSALAAESDLTAELVDASIFAPFSASVARHPCGLAVNILPFRSQPAAFWREALKMLMHSLSMSMVRGRAVVSFLERIQGPASGTGPASTVTSNDNSSGNKCSEQAGGAPASLGWGPPGWLELRKGFDVELGADGLLVVFRDGVLAGKTAAVAAAGKAPGNAHQGQGLDEGQGVWLDVAALPQVLSLPPWSITVGIAGTDPDRPSEAEPATASATEQATLSASAPARALQRVRDLLSGDFSYELDAPLSRPSTNADGKFSSSSSARARLVLWSSLGGGRKTRAPPPPALAGVDLRLRAGLPLLVAAETEAGCDGGVKEGASGDGADGVKLRLRFRYCPPN